MRPICRSALDFWVPNSRTECRQLSAAGRQLSDPTGKAVGVEGWIRRTYGAVLWLCCAYYYVSIPLLLVLVLR